MPSPVNGTVSADTVSPMLGEAWRLDGSVALRPEPFGALDYHFGTRRLSFLKTPELVDLVRNLASGTVRDALVASGVPEPHWPAYTCALEGLAAGGMITRRETP